MPLAATLAAALSALALVAAAAAAPATARTSATVRVHASRFGRVLLDGRGFALYAFTRDRAGRSACDGACAKAWPPYLASRVRGNRLLGTTRRGDGSLQVTYAGRPLYHYVGDREPGQILCQDVAEFGGTWLVVGPTGSLVR